MKKTLLLGFSIVVFILGIQQESKTQTEPRKVIQTTDVRHGKTSFIAFDSDQTQVKIKPVEEGEMRAASSKAIKLMQHSQGLWYKRQTCTSCHHQLLPEITLKLARERGIPFDENAARDTTKTAFAYLKDLDSAVQGYDFIDVYFDGWALATAHRDGISP